MFFCNPVEKVTVIGFGTYTIPEVNLRFYIESFTNVSILIGGTFKKLEVSGEYQHFSLFVTPSKYCQFTTI
jgi:hypothetical protein